MRQRYRPQLPEFRLLVQHCASLHHLQELLKKFQNDSLAMLNNYFMGKCSANNFWSLWNFPSGNSMVPFPSRSTSMTRLFNSSSVGFCPIALITYSSSLEEMAPLPSFVDINVINWLGSGRDIFFARNQNHEQTEDTAMSPVIFV